jgi:hypothetical protein
MKKRKETPQKFVDRCIKEIRCYFYDCQPFETKKRLRHENRNYSYMYYTYHIIDEASKIELSKSIESVLYNQLNGKNK